MRFVGATTLHGMILFRCDNCAALYRYALMHRELGAICPMCHRPVPAHMPRRRRKGPGGRGVKIRERLARRDGWRCHLCGRLIVPTATGSHAPTIDHVVPLALGGSNAMENLRLAHAFCNSRRGTRPCGESAAQRQMGGLG